jgi:hypothetical protein
MYLTVPDFEPTGRRRALVIPVSDIFFACHLIPKYHMLILTYYPSVDIFG